MSLLTKIDANIWVVNADPVQWYGLPYTTRMTVIKLSRERLWIHSPCKLSQELIEEINRLGQVHYLVSPNKIHHLFIQDWISRFPTALSLSSPGLAKKRKDISFDRELNDAPESEWRNEIDQLIFKGSIAMQEVVFFHKSSQTLILTDLIENFPPKHFSGFKNVIAKLSGIVSPKGKTPIDWRLSFLFGRSQARQCLEKILAWHPKKIIISHGECIFENAHDFLLNSFSWLNPSKL